MGTTEANAEDQEIELYRGDELVARFGRHDADVFLVRDLSDPMEGD